MNTAIPILMYHQVTPHVHPNFERWTVTPKSFASHMRILKVLGYNTVSLDDLHDYNRLNINLTRKPIIITFDDGYQEAIDYTIPILTEYNYSAVYFIPTRYIGEQSHWLLPELGAEFPIIDWDTVISLDSNGFQIGSHTMTHPHLTTLPPVECHNEIEESRRTIEDHLGHDVVHFAYPHGDFNTSVRSIVADAGYHTACSVKQGFTTHKDDQLALPRIEITGYDTLVDFIFKIYTTYNRRNYTNTLLWEFKIYIRRMISKIISK